MASTAKRAIVIATVPTTLALVVVAFAVLEQAAVDPTVSAGRLGSSFVPVWYAPLSIFAVSHTICQLVTMRGQAIPGLVAGGLATVVAIFFHLAAGPSLAGEAIYGSLLVFAQLFPPLIFLLPLVVILAIAVPGALFGLSVYAPLAVANRIGIADGTGGTPTRNALILAGIIVAFVCVLAFGVPSDAARGARGGYTFERTTAQSAWFVMASVIALCCAVIALLGAWPSATARAGAVTSWLKGFVVPVAALVAMGGPAVNAMESSAALRSLRSAPGLAAASRYFRDGRSIADDPILFANGELRIDRKLVRYQLADNAERRITTVAMHPPPEMQAIGVVDRIILNGWHAEPHRKEAEHRRAICTDSATRPVVECRVPSTGAVVIQIDKDRPERGLVRSTTLKSTSGCIIIVTGVAERSFGIRADFDCALVDDWPRRAAEIERYITALHIVR